MWLLLGSRCRGWRRSTNGIADDSICGGRIAVVRIAFYERVIDQKGRAFQRTGLRSIGGEGATVDSAEQITGLRITDRGFRHINRDCPVGIVVAGRIGSSLQILLRHSNY